MAFPWSFFGAYNDPLDDDPLKRRDWCFNTTWIRPKTTTKSVNVILPHRSNWLICTVHSIACHAATLSSPSDFVYSELHSTGKNGITSMNNVFRKIKGIYDNDPDNCKPQQYTNGLTSHSIRGGAEQLMHESSQLRREWSDRRVGRVRRSDSRESYISCESWHDDYACALVLCGWPSIHCGGKCPNKSSIPETDHRTFDAFVGNIFVRVPMVPVQILEMWGCILLLWHFEVKKLHPDSDVILKLESILSVETILQWHECVKEAFKNNNQNTLPLHTVQQLSVAENLSWQNVSISKLQEDVRYLANSHGTQERFNTAIVERLDLLQEASNRQTDSLATQSTLLQQILDAVSMHPPKRRKTNVDEQVHVQAVVQFPRINQPQPIQEVNGLNVVLVEPARRMGKLSDRLRNIDTVFYTWYIEELWYYQGRDPDERSFLRNTISTLILYMKRFIPPDCLVLSEKPPEDQVEQRRNWVSDLRKLSLAVKKRTMDFVQDYQVTVKTTPLRNCVLEKALTYAVRKYLMQIPVDRFPPLQVVDNITRTTPYIINNVDLQSFHKFK